MCANDITSQVKEDALGGGGRTIHKLSGQAPMFGWPCTLIPR